ncbi:c-type cytochrome [Stenotrophobium rhamnosiphilum]|nr:c-type cytochrome [Stenotrophobium rhamnosiphilum]
MYSTHIRNAFVAIALTMTLAACGGGTSAPAPAAAPAAPAAPATPATIKLYGQTCHNCHSIPGTGAPQAGDTKAWSGRLYKGREALLNNSINGYRSMPPMGGCTQCTEEDFAALIEYMSGSQLK